MFNYIWATSGWHHVLLNRPTNHNNKLAFLTLCDLALNPPFLGGKIIELGKFCFIKTEFEPNLLCFSK